MNIKRKGSYKEITTTGKKMEVLFSKNFEETLKALKAVEIFPSLASSAIKDTVEGVKSELANLQGKVSVEEGKRIITLSDGTKIDLAERLGAISGALEGKDGYEGQDIEKWIERLTGQDTIVKALSEREIDKDFLKAWSEKKRAEIEETNSKLKENASLKEQINGKATPVLEEYNKINKLMTEVEALKNVDDKQNQGLITGIEALGIPLTEKTITLGKNTFTGKSVEILELKDSIKIGLNRRMEEKLNSLVTLCREDEDFKAEGMTGEALVSYVSGYVKGLNDSIKNLRALISANEKYAKSYEELAEHPELLGGVDVDDPDAEKKRKEEIAYVKMVAQGHTEAYRDDKGNLGYIAKTAKGEDMFYYEDSDGKPKMEEAAKVKLVEYKPRKEITDAIGKKIDEFGKKFDATVKPLTEEQKKAIAAQRKKDIEELKFKLMDADIKKSHDKELKKLEEDLKAKKLSDNEIKQQLAERGYELLAKDIKFDETTALEEDARKGGWNGKAPERKYLKYYATIGLGGPNILDPKYDYDSKQWKKDKAMKKGLEGEEELIKASLMKDGKLDEAEVKKFVESRGKTYEEPKKGKHTKLKDIQDLITEAAKDNYLDGLLDQTVAPTIAKKRIEAVEAYYGQQAENELNKRVPKDPKATFIREQLEKPETIEAIVPPVKKVSKAVNLQEQYRSIIKAEGFGLVNATQTNAPALDDSAIVDKILREVVGRVIDTSERFQPKSVLDFKDQRSAYQAAHGTSEGAEVGEVVPDFGEEDR